MGIHTETASIGCHAGLSIGGLRWMVNVDNLFQIVLPLEAALDEDCWASKVRNVFLWSVQLLWPTD